MCRRLETRDLIIGDIPVNPCQRHENECAFFYFCCRDLIRWHSEVPDDPQKEECLGGNIQHMIDRYSDIPQFHGYNLETIKKVSDHIWGKTKLYDLNTAKQINALIAPYPMEDINELRDIPDGDKQKIKIMNSISQLLTHIRNR